MRNHEERGPSGAKNIRFELPIPDRLISASRQYFSIKTRCLSHNRSGTANFFRQEKKSPNRISLVYLDRASSEKKLFTSLLKKRTLPAHKVYRFFFLSREIHENVFSSASSASSFTFLLHALLLTDGGKINTLKSDVSLKSSRRRRR